jgi:uncharacterized protein YciI
LEKNIINKTMKTLFIFSSLLIISLSGFAQDINTRYDSLLAKKLGADERGMKMYVLVILKTGSNIEKDKVKRDSLFKGHFANIAHMAGAGKLALAGPLEENNKTYRGIFILNVSSFEEARQLLDADPTVKEKIFEPELYQWYGSAALPEYLPLHRKIQKTKIF